MQQQSNQLDFECFMKNKHWVIGEYYSCPYYNQDGAEKIVWYSINASVQTGLLKKSLKQ